MTPTEILKEEHRAIERMLNVLEKLVMQSEEGKTVPAEHYKNALTFIKQFADGCHHYKEETLLFPAMEEIGFPKEYGPIGVMLHEHDLGRQYVRKLSDAVQHYSSGDVSALPDLKASALLFSELLRNHIMKEDNILFMMADARLPQQKQEMLSEQFSEAEFHGQSCMQKKALLAMLQELELQVSFSK